MCQDLADLFFPCLQLNSYLKFNFTKPLKIANPLNLHITQAALKMLVKCSDARNEKQRSGFPRQCGVVNKV